MGGEEVETLLITPWMWKEEKWLHGGQKGEEKTLSRKEETQDFPNDPVARGPPANAGDTDSIPGCNY